MTNGAFAFALLQATHTMFKLWIITDGSVIYEYSKHRKTKNKADPSGRDAPGRLSNGIWIECFDACPGTWRFAADRERTFARAAGAEPGDGDTIGVLFREFSRVLVECPACSGPLGRFACIGQGHITDTAGTDIAAIRIPGKAGCRENPMPTQPGCS